MGLGGFGAGPARRAPPTLLEGAGQAPPLTGCLALFILFCMYSAEAEMDFHTDHEPSEAAKLQLLELFQLFAKQNGSFRRKPTP